MPKLDSLKEDLKTLRFWLGVFVTSALAVAGWVATNYQKVELWFIVASVLIFTGSVIIVFLISKRINKWDSFLFCVIILGFGIILYSAYETIKR